MGGLYCKCFFGEGEHFVSALSKSIELIMSSIQNPFIYLFIYLTPYDHFSYQIFNRSFKLTLRVGYWLCRYFLLCSFLYHFVGLGYQLFVFYSDSYDTIFHSLSQQSRNIRDTFISIVLIVSTVEQSTNQTKLESQASSVLNFLSGKS